MWIFRDVSSQSLLHFLFYSESKNKKYEDSPLEFLQNKPVRKEITKLKATGEKQYANETQGRIGQEINLPKTLFADSKHSLQPVVETK